MSFVLDCENEKNGFSVEDVLTVPVEQTGPVLLSGTELGYNVIYNVTEVFSEKFVATIYLEYPTLKC